MYNWRPLSLKWVRSDYPGFSDIFENQNSYYLNNSVNELPLDENEYLEFKPFDPELSKDNDDDIFNNIFEDLYYNKAKPSIFDILNNLLKTNAQTKSIFVNSNKKGSIRNWNLTNKIKRNLIQDICLKWINYSIDKKELKLKKIEPKLLKKKYRKISDILDLTLNEIYSNDICRIKKRTKDHNRNVIFNMENNLVFQAKMELKFRDALKLFYNKPIENKIFDENVKAGLIDFQEYFLTLIKKNKPTPAYIKKLMVNLDKVFQMIYDNTKPSENTTGPSSEN